MKNKIFKIILFLATIIMVASCEDFLEKNPNDKLSSATFWKTQADLESALAGCYQSLTQGYIGNVSKLAFDQLSENGYGPNPWEGFTTAMQGEAEATTGGVTSGLYNQSFNGVSRCNILLAHIDDVPIEDESTTNRIRGEARFLRAYFYHQLAFYYGDVPKLLDEPSLEDTGLPRSPKSEIIDLVNRDLDFAIENLPDEPYSGHAVKGSALALRARVALYESDWASAAKYAKEVMDLNTFSLANDYAGIFFGKQENNPEIIFSSKFLAPLTYHNLDQNVGYWLSFNVRPAFLKRYEMANGMAIDDEGSGYDPENPYLERDPRLRLSVFAVEGEPWIYDQDGWGHGRIWPTGASPKKYVDPSVAAGYDTQSDQDIVLLRYADVLLTYAEAKNEVSGPVQDVYDAVNEVRARPGIDMPPLPAGLSKNEMREHIRLERQVEMAFEGFAFADLKRWHTAHIVIPQITDDPGGVPRSFDENKNYLFPIPQGEMDKNDTWTQNPGY